MTSLTELTSYLELSYDLGLNESIGEYLHVRDDGQGCTDSEMIMSLVFLNLAGGVTVENMRILECDEGLCRVLDRVKTQGMYRKGRRS